MSFIVTITNHHTKIQGFIKYTAAAKATTKLVQETKAGAPLAGHLQRCELGSWLPVDTQSKSTTLPWGQEALQQVLNVSQASAARVASVSLVHFSVKSPTS